jgi:hypothetical protein
MKATRVERFEYWSFVSAVTVLMARYIGHRENAAVAVAAAGVALILGYIVDTLG